MSEHHRICEAGKTLGQAAATMAEAGRRRMAAEGLTNLGLPRMRDEMCASCACRAGTVPNGCLQTQLDLLKSVVEGKPFLCHAPKDGRMCAGWVAFRAAHVAHPLPAEVVKFAEDWEYSPDEPEPPR